MVFEVSNHDTDLERYCPLRTDINGEMRKCVKGCAWWWQGSCSIARISVHLEMLQAQMDEYDIAMDDLGQTMDDALSEFNSAIRQTADRLQGAVESTKEGEN